MDTVVFQSPSLLLFSFSVYETIEMLNLIAVWFLIINAVCLWWIYKSAAFEDFSRNMLFLPRVRSLYQFSIG